MVIIEQQGHFIIIGAGIAGTFTASRLRKYHYQGKITLIDEGDLPYDRPPLTKEYLTGEMTEDEVHLRPMSFYEEQDINLLMHTKVTHINEEQQSVTLHNGQILHWDKLCIATGASLRRLSRLDQHQFDNVFYLRNFYQAKKFKQALEHMNHIVIIGAGFIGLEVAATLTKLRKKVTILMPTEAPLTRILGEEIGHYIARVHEARGVRFQRDQIADKFIGKNGKLTQVITTDGTVIECDGVLVSIGVLPDLSMVEDMLTVSQRGIVVDAYGETSIPNIYAVGDCTTWPDPHSNQQMRTAHWEHAFGQANIVAQNMITQHSKTYEKIPYFWSNQYEFEYEYLGQPNSWDETVIRGNMSEHQFIVFYLLAERIVGAFFVNQQEEVAAVKQMMKENKTWKRAALEDIGIPLGEKH